MSQKDGVIAQAQPHSQEKQHQGNARDDIRIEQGHISQAPEEHPALAAHLPHAQGRHQRQHGGKNRRSHADGQGIGEGGDDFLILDEPFIPLPGKARPLPTIAAGVEGLGDEHQDRRIEEEHNGSQISFFQLFHHGLPFFLCSPLSVKASRRIFRMMKTMSTMERALPSCQS